ncbi:molybdopterin-dependent oxidoreductase alpha subunit [Sphingomonas zeicaulis]|uniref:FdhF/YdeP family oxidoreductase n=1 Tax=Sphingomonas zeicaulis TaxID=1632740 RepID=UPI003D190FC7
MAEENETVHSDAPAGGWGSLSGISKTFAHELSTPAALNTLRRQNKVKGFMCVSCAWTKPAQPHPFEFCENGAKATLWELTSRRCTPEFFAEHSVKALRNWSDHDLEQAGRLTHPLRYDAASDRYVECSWEEAFAAIGQELKAIDPESAIFYVSGRASLETSYLYALFARLYGHNNLPDSSNMCHETTSVALKATIGAPVGTCKLADFDQCDAIFFFGQNTGSNSPRFLHPLQEAVKRGTKIVTFNPVREKGLIEFTNPQNPVEMLSGGRTPISCLYLQVRPGGDIAAITGMIKHVLAADAADWAVNKHHVLDVDFIAQHTTGFEALKSHVDAIGWDEIEQESGLARVEIEAAAQVYVEADKSIGVYGMGLTQHAGGYDNVAMLVNLLLLKGNIGWDGTGISPVRGHSNVQGQRTVGISEKPELVPLDTIAAQFGFEPPRKKGRATVETCEGVIDGSVRAFIGLGGNFLRAVPEQVRVEAAWPRLRLTVHIATKLNRTHLLPGAVAYLLPCLGRSEEDEQATGPQAVTMEDSLSCIHGSLGKNRPASPHLRSEPAIVAGIAKATLPPNPKVRWDAWVGNYAEVRDLIEETYPDEFAHFNDRVFTPGGFYKGNAARERVWKTDAKKAVFTVPKALNSTGFEEAPGRYRLITMRSNDQFNTTIYGYSDRLRGIEGKRDVLLINPEEMTRAGLAAGQRVSLLSDAGDGIERRVDGLEVTPFLLPDGCLGAYYPEANPLVPLSHHDEQSKTPAYKTVPVRIVA